MTTSIEERAARLAAAARQMEQAANLARVTIHELVRAELPGAVDVANRALYELARASEALSAQARALNEEDE